MIQGVTFGIKHSYEDFGLILSSKEIGLPTPKTELVSVIGRNGDLDLTDALGDDVKFENRKLSFTFSLLNGARDWTATLSNLSNYLHGKKMELTDSRDLPDMNLTLSSMTRTNTLKFRQKKMNHYRIKWKLHRKHLILFCLIHSDGKG